MYSIGTYALNIEYIDMHVLFNSNIANNMPIYYIYTHLHIEQKMQSEYKNNANKKKVKKIMSPKRIHIYLLYTYNLYTIHLCEYKFSFSPNVPL